MPLQEALTDLELVIILGRTHARLYKILDALYPDKRLNLMELQEMTKFDMGNLSRTLTKLENYQLIETTSEESTHGKPFRYAKLTKNTQMLLGMIKMVTLPKMKVEIEDWQIAELIKVIKNPSASRNLSRMAAQQFQSLCQKDPIYMTGKENVKKFFEEVVANPHNYEEETGKLLRASILSSFHQLVTNEKTRDWSLESLYPQLITHMENKNESDEIRTWAAAQVGDVARLCRRPAKRKEAEDKLFDLYFSEDAKPESHLFEELKQQLVYLTSKPLFERVQKKAESSNSKEKARAETILEAMLASFSAPSFVKLV
jgi:DNA-binding PadR family transcriptional regulator